jgi:hypothetical protein
MIIGNSSASMAPVRVVCRNPPADDAPLGTGGDRPGDQQNGDEKHQQNRGPFHAGERNDALLNRR